MSVSPGTEEPGDSAKNHPDDRSQVPCFEEHLDHNISAPRNDVASIQALSWRKSDLPLSVSPTNIYFGLTAVLRPGLPPTIDRIY